jgi:hypothetical protein
MSETPLIKAVFICLDGARFAVQIPFLKTNLNGRVKLKMPPEVWGPLFWHTIHIAALGYSEKPNYSQKKAAKEFFESLIFLLPCDICRKHYTQHLALKPIVQYSDRRQDLLKMDD